MTAAVFFFGGGDVFLGGGEVFRVARGGDHELHPAEGGELLSEGVVSVREGDNLGGACGGEGGDVFFGGGEGVFAGRSAAPLGGGGEHAEGESTDLFHQAALRGVVGPEPGEYRERGVFEVGSVFGGGRGDR